MKKLVNPGKTEYGELFITIEIEDGNLSIVGNTAHSCGQCGELLLNMSSLNEGWTGILAKALYDVWKRWHLNNIRAECSHQRELGWTWLTHPSEPCPECGYKLGSAWLKEELPEWVIKYLESLPESTKEYSENYELEEWLKKHGITMACRRIDYRPDGLMQDMPRGSSHWHVILKRGELRMNLYYSMGPAHKGSPNLIDVFSSVISDSSFEGSFKEFCNEFGYDLKDEYSKKIYDACQKANRKFMAFLGEELFEEALGLV